MSDLVNKLRQAMTVDASSLSVRFKSAYLADSDSYTDGVRDEARRRAGIDEALLELVAAIVHVEDEQIRKTWTQVELAKALEALAAAVEAAK